MAIKWVKNEIKMGLKWGYMGLNWGKIRLKWGKNETKRYLNVSFPRLIPQTCCRCCSRRSLASASSRRWQSKASLTAARCRRRSSEASWMMLLIKARSCTEASFSCSALEMLSWLNWAQDLGVEALRGQGVGENWDFGLKKMGFSMEKWCWLLFVV